MKDEKAVEGRGGGGRGPSASLVAPVPSPNFPCQDRCLAYFLAVACQAEVAHEVNETCCEVPPPAVLAGGVVEGERVMVVVEAFPWGQKERERNVQEQAELGAAAAFPPQRANSLCFVVRQHVQPDISPGVTEG